MTRYNLYIYKYFYISVVNREAGDKTGESEYSQSLWTFSL